VSLEFLPWEPPATGEVTAAVGGVRWLRMPVPGSLAHINLWLAPGSRGPVLIDTGMHEPQTAAAWEVLGEREALAGRLEAILVTHHHPDHFGMAARLAARFGVPVRMSVPARAAAERAQAPLGGATPEGLTEYRGRWGVDFAELFGRAGARRVLGSVVSGIPAPAAPIAEGERIAELGAPWQASLHFGHADGHVCLHWAEGGVMISGDQLLPSISSNVSLYPGLLSQDPLADYLASLERLAQLPPETVVLPAHGQPIRGAAARARQLQRGHQQRLELLRDITREPRDTAAVVGALFAGRSLDGWNSLLAFGETLAHIAYLHARGGLERLAEGGTVRWRSS